jgi:hypothetical protein
LAKVSTALGAAGAALGLAFATGAQAENWYNFYMVPAGVAFVDKDSLIYRPGHISARVQSTFPGPQRLQKNGQILTYTKSVDTIDIDCKARVYRFLNRNLFNDAGQAQTSISDPDNVMLIQDGTPQDVLAKGFCAKK